MNALTRYIVQSGLVGPVIPYRDLLVADLRFDPKWQVVTEVGDPQIAVATMASIAARKPDLYGPAGILRLRVVSSNG